MTLLSHDLSYAYHWWTAEDSAQTEVKVTTCMLGIRYQMNHLYLHQPGLCSNALAFANASANAAFAFALALDSFAADAFALAFAFD